MSKRKYLILFFVGLIVSFTTALLQHVPGYMDAEYYYAGGIQLAEGEGFYESFLWNYLDDPAGLPHPSHTYWMPLPSLIAAAGMILAGSRTFLSARLLFILLAACVPVVTAQLAKELGQSDTNAILAGLLAVFPGFYVVYLINTETFTLYMLLGSIFLWLATRTTVKLKSLFVKSFALGLVAGMMHQTRAEGLIWLLPAAIVVVYDLVKSGNAHCATRKTKTILRVAFCLLMLLTGYLLIMLPWYSRNLSFYGSLMSPGGSKTMWLTNYDQTFSYPAGELTPSNWITMGWRFHIAARWNAFIANMKNLLGVQGEIFLLPLMLLGIWRARKKPIIWLAGLIWLMILGLMTVVFPYSGARGGYLHSGAALQPLLWVLAVVGLDVFLAFGERIRNWDVRKAKPVFGSGLVALSAFLTISIFYMRIYGGDIANPIWEKSWKEHVEIREAINQYDMDAESLIMINNPPGYFVSTGLPAIVIPDGNLDTLTAVVERYGARYVVVQKDHVAGLSVLYESPGDVAGMRYVGNAGDAKLYEVLSGKWFDQ